LSLCGPRNANITATRSCSPKSVRVSWKEWPAALRPLSSPQTFT
jgi:hypothetical protein